jgi:hypothetical protein
MVIGMMLLADRHDVISQRIPLLHSLQRPGIRPGATLVKAHLKSTLLIGSHCNDLVQIIQTTIIIIC